MNWQFTPFLIPTILAAGVAAGLALYARSRRYAPGVFAFQLLMGAIVLWCLGYAWELAAVELAAKNSGAMIKYLGVILVSPVFLVFALSYSRKNVWLTVRLFFLLALEPILFLLLIWTNDFHGFMWPSIRLEELGAYKARVTSHGWAFYVHALYAYGILLLASFLMIRATFRHGSLYRGQGLYVVIAVLTPVLANILYLSGLNPFRPFDLTPFSFVITGVMLSFSVFRFQLLNIVPIAHDQVFRIMQDGFIALDNLNRVVAINPAARNIVGIADPNCLGKRAAEVLSAWPDLLELCSLPFPAGPSVLAGSPHGQEFYEVQLIPLQGDGKSSPGRLLVLHNVTERIMTEEALQKSQEQLERRVEERTRELEIANHRLLEEIQERRQTQAILKESEERYRQLVEQPFDGVYVHRGGYIIYINKTGVRLLGGKSRDEILGRSILEFIHSEYKEFVAQRIQAISEGAETVPLAEEKFVRLDGKVIDVEVAGNFLMYEGLASVMVVFRDITERKLAEEAFRQTHLVVENSPAVLFRWRAAEGWPVAMVSENVIQFGYTAQELLSGAVPYAAMVHPDDLDRVSREVREYSASGAARFQQEYRIVAKDGRVFWIDDRTLVERNGNGQITFYQGIVLDISERKLAEEKLRTAHEELETRVKERTADLKKSNLRLEIEVAERQKAEEEMRRAKEIAETANRAKSDFLATMSHELRTPLNHIIGFTEMVVDKQFGPLSETQEEYLNDVLESSRHLLGLINDILDLSKVEAGKMTLDIEQVPLQALLEGTLFMVQERALKHHITLSTEWGELPEWVEVDGRKLKQVMFNLLSNAVKFTPEGGRVTVKAGPVALSDGKLGENDPRPLLAPNPDNGSQAESGEGVIVSVEDTGIGIQKEDLERIFKPFEQVANPLNRSHDGTGLGLPLSRRMIELHGGWIWAESEGLDKGSAFRFVIPNHPIPQKGRELWILKPS